MKRILLSFILLGSMLASTQAQSLHYTYWDNAPLAINPGLAGGYHGTVRVSGIHRSQYEYSTLADLGVEYNLNFRPRKRDWISAGISLASDRAGEFSYRANLFRLGGAYHLALDKDAKSDLALGVQMVSGSLSLDDQRLMGDNLTFVQLANGGGDDPDLTALQGGMSGGGGANPGQIEGNFTDWRAGLVYSNRGKKGNMSFGIQAANILRPNISIAGDRRGRVDMRIGGIFLMDRMINDRLSILPAALAQFQGGFSEIQLRGMMGYEMKQEYRLRLKGGLGYRVGDAVQFVFGADYKDWKFGLAFDLTTSQLSEANGGAGAVEVSAVKNFIIRKKPDVKPVIFCPRI